MADTKFREKKFVENNPKNKFPEQGIIHVNVVWQYPIQLQNRVQGLPPNTWYQTTKKKNLELILFKNRKKKFHKTSEKLTQKNIYHLRFKPLV